MSSFTYRLAFDEDMESLQTLLADSGLTLQSDRGHDFEDGSGGFVIALSDDQNIVGAVGIELHGQYCLLHNAAVAQTYQRQGIGGTLVSRAIDWARFQDCVELYTIVDDARPFFTNWGFLPIDTNLVPGPIRTSPWYAEHVRAETQSMFLAVENIH